MIRWPHLGLWGDFEPCEPGILAAINQNFFTLDVLTQASILDFVETLPEDPLDGDTYIVEDPYPYAGGANSIMVWDGNEWVAIEPQAGFIAYVASEGNLFWYNGTDWVLIPTNIGDVSGPASSTNNAIARFDGTTGKLLQDSGVIIDDTDNVSGINQLNANIVEAILTQASLFDAEMTEDSSSSGANVDLPQPLSMLTKLTGAVTSVDTIAPPDVSPYASFFVYVNETGGPVTFNNGPSLVTGSGSNLTVKDDGAIWLIYDPEESRYMIIGGSGGGGILTVPDIAARNAIPSSDRYQGFMVHVVTTPPVSTGTTYQLMGGITNSDWREVVFSENIQTLTNKIFDGGTAGGTSRITLPKAAKSILDGLTRIQGTIFYDTTSNRPYYDDGSNIFPLGGSVGSINLITNPSAEIGTTGWAVYNDGPGATRPIDGTGGSGPFFISIATTSTNPIFGSNSFLISKSAVNAQGQGVSTDFSIPLGYRAKALSVKLAYIVSSGTFTAGTRTTDSDLILDFYDITNGKIVEPSSIKFLSNSTSVTDTLQATVQFDLNCTNARLILHSANNTTSGWQIKIDDVEVSPSNYQHGTPITDMASYAGVWGSSGTLPSLGNGTSLFVAGRNGDRVIGRINITAGSTTTFGSGNFSFSLPPGLTADLNKIRANESEVGQWKVFILATGNRYSGAVTLFGNSLTLNIDNGTTAVSATTPATLANGSIIDLDFSIPIQGWSSSVQTSDQTDTRVVDYSGNKTSNEAVTANVTNISFSTLKDSLGAWTGTTYPIQTPGDYNVGAVLAVSTSTTTLSVYKNGTIYKYLATLDSTGHRGGIVLLPDLKTGDVVSLRISNSLTIVGDSGNSISISRVSGPATIGANETVSVIAKTSAGQAFANNTVATVIFGTKEDDSHGCLNTSNGVFTAPTSGRYLVSSTVSIIANAVTFNFSTITVRVNAGTVAYGTQFSGTTAANAGAQISWSITRALQLKAGDTVDINFIQNSGSSRNLEASALSNYLTIMKIGI